MREQPDGAALLDVARDVLLTSLLPVLPASHRFAARMVANAMAIASREMSEGVASLDEPAARTLASGIRAGRHDPGSTEGEATAAILWRYAIERCTVSMPKALLARGLRPEREGV